MKLHVQFEGVSPFRIDIDDHTTTEQMRDIAVRAYEELYNFRRIREYVTESCVRFLDGYIIVIKDANSDSKGFPSESKVLIYFFSH